MNNYTYNNIESSSKKGDHRPVRSLPENIKARRRQIKVIARETLTQRLFHNPVFKRAIRITGSSIDEWLNQPHKHYVEKNELLLNLGEVLEKSTYLGDSTYKRRLAHIFETTLCGEATWIVVTDVPGRGATIYSISDSPNILNGITKPV